MNALFLFYLIFILIFIYSVTKGFGLFSPMSLVMTTTLPYSFAPIIDISFFNNSNDYDVENINSLIVYCTTFYIPITIFSWLSIAQNKRLTNNSWKCYWNFNSSLYALGFIILFLIYIKLSIGISVVADEGRAAIYKNKPLLFDLIKLLISAYIVSFTLIYINSPKPIIKAYVFLLLAMFLFAETLVLGDRRVWLITFLATSSVFFSHVERVPLKAIPIVIAGVAFLLAVGVMRGGGSEAADFLRVLNISNMEFGTFGKIYDYCASSGCEFNNYSYTNIPSQLIPSLLTDSRALPPSALYALNYDFDYYSSGGTYAYNFILESMQNFNVIGPALMGSVIGFIFYLQSRMKSDFKYVMGAILVFSFSFFFRMELLSIVKAGLIWAVLFLILLLINSKFTKPSQQ